MALLTLLVLAWAAPANAQVIRYYHTDITGTVVAVTDENANVIERRVYEPYGLPQTPILDGPGYTGHDMDGETGLVYMQQRYYDPLIGRFLSVDPMAVSTATAWNFNRYNYAANNPYLYTDPDGEAVAAVRGAFWVGTRVGAAINYSVVAATGSTIGVLLYNAVHNENGSAAELDESPRARDEAGTADSDEGCIYCVSGENTSSGKDYIGSTDDLDRRARDTSDGRDRTDAEKVDTYRKGDRTDRQNKEQQAMNDRGGKENLDNKRNEVAPKRWDDRGITPPQ